MLLPSLLSIIPKAVEPLPPIALSDSITMPLSAVVSDSVSVLLTSFMAARDSTSFSQADASERDSQQLL